MLSARVSHLEQFRIWKHEEDLSLDWLLSRIRGDEEPSDAMKAGTAFHSAIERTEEGELGTLAIDNYRFDFNCDCAVVLPQIRETKVEKQYGDLLVNGTFDALRGKEITDYKTTGQFDPDRYMEGYQWRFYLDMTGCDSFCWQIFVMREFGEPGCYSINQTHTLRQKRYPSLHEDCAMLAREFVAVMKGQLQEVA